MNCALDDNWYILSGFYFVINYEINRDQFFLIVRLIAIKNFNRTAALEEILKS